MAYLKNLLVTGQSRFLNKIYCADIDASGTVNLSAFSATNATLSGTLGVTGDTTLSNLTATGTINAAGNINSNADIACETLRAKYYDLQTVFASSGGALIVAPTINFPSDSTQVTRSIVVTKPTTTSCTINIADASIQTLNDAYWRNGSKVRFSGIINGVQTDTMDGEITSINTTSGTMTLSVSGGNAKNVAAGLYSYGSYEKLSVMVYEVLKDNHDYKVGILLNAIGNNDSAVMDVYSGEHDSTVVRAGNINGLSYTQSNGSTGTLSLENGWGFYAKGNAYIEGHIVANSGRFANWTISDNLYYNSANPGSTSITLSPAGKDSTTSIGGSSGSNNWAFTVKNIFGVTTSGVLYTSDVRANGGTIGGWGLTNNAIYSSSTDTTGIQTTIALQNTIMDVTTTNCIVSADSDSITLTALKDGNMSCSAVKLPISGQGAYTITLTITRPSGTEGEYYYSFMDSSDQPIEFGMDLFTILLGPEYMVTDTESFSSSGSINPTSLNVSFGLWSCKKDDQLIVKFTIERNGTEIPIGWDYIINDMLPSNVVLGVTTRESNTVKNPFYLTNTGKLHCENIEAIGMINATSGELGGWNVTKHSLYSKTVDENSNPITVALQNAILNADLENCEVTPGDGQITVKVLEDGVCYMENFRILAVEPYVTNGFAIQGNVTHTGNSDSNIDFAVKILTIKNNVERVEYTYHVPSGLGSYSYEYQYNTPQSQWPDYTLGAQIDYRIYEAAKGDIFTITFQMHVADLYTQVVPLDWTTDLLLPASYVMGIQKNSNMLYSLASNGYVKARKLTVEHGSYAQYNFKTPLREACLEVNNTGLLGIYDRTNRSWMIRSDTNQKVYIPHNLSVTGTLETTDNITVTKTSGDTSIGAANSTRNGKLLVNSSGVFGLYDSTNSKWLIQSATDQSVSVPHNFSITGTLNVSSTIDSSNITVTTSSSAAARLGVKCTNVREGRFQINTNGDFGIYDVTDNSWVIRSDSSKEVYVPQLFRARGWDSTTSRASAQSNNTDGRRIGYLSSPSQTEFEIRGQWGASAFSTKTITLPTSDVRLKDNIANTEVKNALSVIDKIHLRSFDWKDEAMGHQKIGFIADELEIIDEKLSIGGGVDEDGGIKFKAVNTFYLQGYEVKAIQELHKLVKTQARKIEKLEKIIEELKG